MHKLWERSLSRDRRCSRRRTYAVCLVNRVIPFCCRCAPDRGQATLLQGICGVARFLYQTQNLWEIAGKRAPTRDCGVVKLWERGLSRDRRRSRRRTGPCGLPGESRHPILLPLRARSRASALLQGFAALPKFVSSAELVGANLLAIGDAVVVEPGHAVCLVNRVIRFCCRCAPDRGQARSYKGFAAL